jgi:prevent-host-death family protein
MTQRELRNDSGRIMRALDKGKAIIVTRNGVPVGGLIPPGNFFGLSDVLEIISI